MGYKRTSKRKWDFLREITLVAKLSNGIHVILNDACDYLGLGERGIDGEYKEVKRAIKWLNIYKINK